MDDFMARRVSSQGAAPPVDRLPAGLAAAAAGAKLEAERNPGGSGTAKRRRAKAAAAAASASGPSGADAFMDELLGRGSSARPEDLASLALEVAEVGGRGLAGRDRELHDRELARAKGIKMDPPKGKNLPKLLAERRARREAAAIKAEQLKQEGFIAPKAVAAASDSLAHKPAYLQHVERKFHDTSGLGTYGKRGVKATLGTYSGGVLKLSKKDLATISGAGKGGKKHGKSAMPNFGNGASGGVSKKKSVEQRVANQRRHKRKQRK